MNSSSSNFSEETDFDPYPFGQTLVLKQHTPDPACRDWGYKSHLPTSPISQLEWCLNHPPSTGITNQRCKREVTFTKNIRTGRECGAQILLTRDGLVAKVYDLLHYLSYEFYDPSLKIDVVAAADHDYSVEANAYSAMIDSGVQGDIMPTYYGSWTFEVGTEVEGQEYTREIRMILVEHVVGISMADLAPYYMNDEEKKNILHKALEAETDLRIAGIGHLDFEPRNVIVIPSPQFELPKGWLYDSVSSEGSELRVCYIDFAMSTAIKKPVPEKRHNPLFTWSGCQPWARYDWCSKDEDEVADWMWDMWGNGAKAEKYVLVTRRRLLERFQ